MRFRSVATLLLLAAATGCAGTDRPTSPISPDAEAMTSGESSPIIASVTGAGHVMRNLGAGDELTTFSYSAIGRADGSASGQYQYTFRAADFSMHGSVTCVSVLGNQGWVGGVIDKVKSDDPADQALVGTEVWWRAIDNGEGSEDAADLTTSVLLATTGPTTSASWCRDQQERGPVRPIIAGNIQVR